MALFNSYVKLPEGKNLNILQFLVGLFSSWASATHGPMVPAISSYHLLPCPAPHHLRIGPIFDNPPANITRGWMAITGTLW